MTYEYKITSSGWFHDERRTDNIEPVNPEGAGWRLRHTNILHGVDDHAMRFVWTWEREIKESSK
jgi:hypothetical protein